MPQTDDSPPPLLPRLPPPGEELYNALMQRILPELMIPEVHELNERYKDESEEERKARGLRYKEAFEEYNKQYKEYIDSKNAEMNAFNRDLGAYIESVYRKDEEKEMSDLESTINSF